LGAREEHIKTVEHGLSVQQGRLRRLPLAERELTQARN